MKARSCVSATACYAVKNNAQLVARDSARAKKLQCMCNDSRIVDCCVLLNTAQLSWSNFSDSVSVYLVYCLTVRRALTLISVRTSYAKRSHRSFSDYYYLMLGNMKRIAVAIAP